MKSRFAGIDQGGPHKQLDILLTANRQRFKRYCQIHQRDLALRKSRFQRRYLKDALAVISTHKSRKKVPLQSQEPVALQVTPGQSNCWSRRMALLDLSPKFMEDPQDKETTG